MPDGHSALLARRLVRPSLRWPLLFGLWAIPGLVSASQLYLLSSSDGPSFLTALEWQVPPWMFWALATPLIVRLAGRYRLERGAWPTSVAVHLMANVALGWGHVLCLALWGRAIMQPFYCHPFGIVLAKLSTKHMPMELLTYWGVVATAHALDYHRRFRERALAAAQLETRLAQAQLEALKMQLHPHFLFNTLHAIAVLTRKGDTQGSIRMIAGLSDLLRMALDTVGQQLVPLQQELGFAARYLEIEKVRFQDRLAVTTEVAPDTLPALVPNLVLQPLVENAVRHGVGARAEAGRIEIRAHRAGSSLVVTVLDDGPGPRAGWRPGVGLGNVRERLQRLFPGCHRLELVAAEGGGALATLEIPFAHG